MPSNLDLARNGGPRLHWTDPTPEQRAAREQAAIAERARIAQAEANGLTGDGIPLVLITSEPSEIEGCAEYNAVSCPPADGWQEFTRWREHGREIRIFKRS